MTYRNTTAAAVLIFGLAASSAAARPAPNTGTPVAVQQLLDCRAIGDSAQRLACYDRQAGVIGQAIATRELVVIDKARANVAKRSLFGFSVPNFGGLFGSASDDIKQIESTVAGVGQNGDGGWVVKLADGSVWSQVDDAMLGLPPRRGDKVIIKRGLMGSFYLELGKQPGFKAKRIG
ncbi:MAG: hypothetical protein QFB89_07085 [Pseudomonadota bacterium]|nr:hypothetical protein [Pseudomonadota bacterium]